MSLNSHETVGVGDPYNLKSKVSVSPTIRNISEVWPDILGGTFLERAVNTSLASDGGEFPALLNAITLNSYCEFSIKSLTLPSQTSPSISTALRHVELFLSFFSII